MNLLDVPAWHADAACAEYADRADWWFPERGEDDRYAKAICADCLVRAECAAAALDDGTRLPGVWGGTSGRDRRRLRALGVTGDLVRREGVDVLDLHAPGESRRVIQSTCGPCLVGPLRSVSASSPLSS